MARHVVAAVDDVPPGGRKLVQVNGRAIVVFNLDGEFFALNNRCPHRGGSLCHGVTTRRGRPLPTTTRRPHASSVQTNSASTAVSASQTISWEGTGEGMGSVAMVNLSL